MALEGQAGVLAAAEPILQGRLESALSELSELSELSNCCICQDDSDNGLGITELPCREAPGPEYEVQGNSGIQGCRALCACVLFSSAWIVCFLYFFMKDD